MKYRIIIGFAISAACVVFALYRIDFGQLAASLMQANTLCLSIAVLFILLTQVIRSMRWKVLLSSVKPTRMKNLLSATSIGAMADMVLPARIGDILRAGVIGRKEKISRVASLATIVIERVYDILTILLILLFVVLFFEHPELKSGAMSGVRAAGVIATGLCLAVIGVLLLLKTRMLTIIHIFEGPFAFLPEKLRMKLSSALDSFALGLQSIQWSWHLAVIVLYSILLWSAFAFSNFFVLQALRFDCHPATAYFILLFQVLGVTLPSSPGFIGTYHAAVVAGLSVFSISFEDALSAAILMHAAFFFPFIVCGLLFLWKENMSLSDIRSVNRETP